MDMDLLHYQDYQPELYRKLDELTSLNYLVLDTAERAFPGKNTYHPRQNLPMPKTKRQEIEFDRLQRFAEQRMNRFKAINDEFQADEKSINCHQKLETFINHFNLASGLGFTPERFHSRETGLFDFSNLYVLAVNIDKLNISNKEKQKLTDEYSEFLLQYSNYYVLKMVEELASVLFDEVTEYGTKSKSYGKDYDFLTRVDNNDLRKFIKECSRFYDNHLDVRNDYVDKLNKYYVSLNQANANDDLTYFTDFVTSMDKMHLYAIAFHNRIYCLNYLDIPLSFRDKLEDKHTPAETKPGSFKVNTTFAHKIEIAEFVRFAGFFPELKEAVNEFSSKYLAPEYNRDTKAEFDELRRSLR